MELILFTISSDPPFKEMSQSQDARRHDEDQRHRTQSTPLKVEQEKNRSVNHLPNDAISPEELKKLNEQTDSRLNEQGPASFREGHHS